MDDTYEVNNKEGGAFRVILDTRLDRIHFDNDTLMFQSLKNGIARWCESLVSDYRYLVMNMNVDIQATDELGNTSAGYSMFEDNTFLKTYMEECGRSYDQAFQNFHKHLNDESLNTAGERILRAYVGKAESFLLSLMTLIRISTPGACRATELCELTFRNRHQVMRAISFDAGMAFIVLNATKNEMSPRLKQYLPSSLSELLKGYLALIRPLTEEVYVKLGRTYSSDFRYYLMHDYTSKFSVEKVRLAHKSLTQQFFGVSIDYVSWRHAMEVMSVVLYNDTNPKLVSLLQYASRYLGHTESTARMHYGHGSMRRNDTTFLIDGVNRDLARSFHCWLGYEDLKPITQTAVYVPATIENLEIKGFKYSFEDIRKVLPGFTWRSAGQKEATMTCLERKESFVCIFPTGGGKSMTFLIPILLESDMHTVIVVPFKALQNDIVRMLSKFNLMASMKNMTIGTKKRVHVITQDTDMFNTILEWHKTGKLARIIIDEAHELDTNWRNPKVAPILSIDCQKIFLSATLPESKIISLKNNFGVTRVIREPTTRSNIEYKVVNFTSFKLMENELKKEMANFKTLMNAEGPPTDHSMRAIIYIGDRLKGSRVSECIPEGIQFGFYFAETLNRDNIQKKFFEGEIQCLIATKAFSTGIDYPNVKLVIHWDGITEITDFEQCSGRAGRNGEPARSIVIAGPNRRRLTSHTNQEERLAINYIMKGQTGCLRTDRTEYFDGQAMNCRTANATLCSNCRSSMPEFQLDDYIPRANNYAIVSENVRNFMNKTRIVERKLCHRHYCLYNEMWTTRTTSENEVFLGKLAGFNSGHCRSCGFKERQSDNMAQHERAAICPYGHCMQEALGIVYDLWSGDKNTKANMKYYKRAKRRLNLEFGGEIPFNEAFNVKGELGGDVVVVALAVFYIDELCLKLQ